MPAVYWVFHQDNLAIADVVEAYCYIVDIGQTDRVQMRSRINSNWCMTFVNSFSIIITCHHNKFVARCSCTQYAANILYAAYKGLHSWNVLHQLLVCYISPHDHFASYSYLLWYVKL